MNWEMIGAISELVGAIGVIVTLVYLAVQVQQNTKYLAESTKLAEAGQIETTLNLAVETRKLLLLNPDLVDLYNRGAQSFLTLDPIEQVRFDQLLRINFLQAQTMYLRYLLFDDDPEGYVGPTRMLEQSLQLLGVREWLNQVETDWRPEFRAWVESAIERIDREKASE